jgi:hypothetical protein
MVLKVTKGMAEMFKKVVSVLLFSIGTSFLMIAVVPFSLILEGGIIALIVFLFCVAVWIALMMAGLGLWGWRKWRSVLGVVFTVVGSLLVLYASILLSELPSSDGGLAGGSALSNLISELLKVIMASFLLFGIAHLAIGFALIIKQRKISQRIYIHEL